MADKNKEAREYNGPCFDSCYNFYSSPDDWKKEAGPGRIERFFEAKKVPFLEKIKRLSVIDKIFLGSNTFDFLTASEIKGLDEFAKALDKFKTENKDSYCYEPDLTKGFWVGSE